MRRLPAIGLGLCGLLCVVPRPARAAVVQIDLSALFDSDVVVNDAGGGYDPTQVPIDSGAMASGNFCFPTDYVAQRAATTGQTPDGLPDDGFFAAGTYHPEVQLGWNNNDDGNNAVQLRFTTGSFRIPVPALRYTELHLFATGGDGDADLEVLLTYADATTDQFPIYVPDWFDDPVETSQAYRLFDNGDRIQPGNGPGTLFLYEDSNDTAIFGYLLSPDSTRVLQDITVTRTDANGVLSFFGVTGVAVTEQVPDLYESPDPANVVTPANLVVAGVTSPTVYTPATAPLLFYQVDDLSGNPPLIYMVRRGLDVEVSF